MRAAVIHTLGEAPSYAEHPDPTPGPGQSLVAVTAAPIVPLDQLCASGTSYFGAPPTPYVPGVQGVGVVQQSDRLPPGTPVWFATSAGMAPGDGSLAELCVVDDDDLVAIPDAVGVTTVAALGLSAVAAWSALTGPGRLSRGERVLVLAAGGVVGQVAVQLARVLGAGRVVGAARSSAARRRAAGAGADAVVPLPDDADPRHDHEVSALAERLAAAGGGGFDVVIDPLCGLAATAATRVLAPHGRLVNLGSSAGAEAIWDSATLRGRSASVLGYTNNDLSVTQRREALLAVLGHAADGHVMVSHDPLPLTDVSEGWERQRAGGADGRIVVTA
jgi:NADPH:quinone reductase-like Zn-dependent oxidoreductase